MSGFLLEMTIGGGQAFPRVPEPDGGLSGSDGMTLLDFFAAHAMVSMQGLDLSHADVARASYEQAEAMLLARKAWFNKAKAAYAAKPTVGTKLNTTG